MVENRVAILSRGPGTTRPGGEQILQVSATKVCPEQPKRCNVFNALECTGQLRSTALCWSFCRIVLVARPVVILASAHPSPRCVR